MKVLIFDVLGDYAFFRTPEGTRGNYSYPFPPPTAIIGLIASILGRERNVYWKETDNLNKCKIALESLKHPQQESIKMNYNQTKSIISLPENLKIMLPKDPVIKGRGFTTQTKINYLKNVHYRIYFSHEDQELYNILKTALINHQYCYPPYLGHANCLAEILFITEIQVDTKAKVPTSFQISGIIPVSVLQSDALGLREGHFKIYYNVPARMKYTESENNPLNITTSKLESFLYQTEDYPAAIVSNSWTSDFFQIHHEDRSKILAFIPY